MICTCDGQSILSDGPNPDCPIHGYWRSDPGPHKTLAERVRFIAGGPHPWIPGGPTSVTFLKEIAAALEAAEVTGSDPREVWQALQPLGTPPDQDKIDAFVAGWKSHAAQPVETLGDINVIVKKMKADGMTRASLLYVVDRVFYEHGDSRDDPRGSYIKTEELPEEEK